MSTKTYFKLSTLCLALLLLSVRSARAQDTEPNNTPDQAIALPVNTYLPGNTDYPGDVDWYKVIMPGDGNINVILWNNYNPLVKTLSWYAKDGVTLLSRGSHGGSPGAPGDSGSGFGLDGLSADTFYLTVDAGQAGAYGVEFDIYLAPGQKDIEPNDLISQALPLPLNDTTNGHVGFIYNPLTYTIDSVDYYKITTAAEGLLRITSLDLDYGCHKGVSLYAGDGTTLLKSTAYCNETGVLEQDSLPAGSYYIAVPGKLGSAAPYTFVANLITDPKNTDFEPNNIISQASVFQLNKSIPGSVGAYYNGQKDTSDWYKIKMADSGALKVSLNNFSKNELTLTFYDNDGIHMVGSSTVGKGMANIETVILAPGAYYAEVNADAGINIDSSSYTITNSFTPLPVTLKPVEQKSPVNTINLNRKPFTEINIKGSPIQKITRTR